MFAGKKNYIVSLWAVLFLGLTTVAACDEDDDADDTNGSMDGDTDTDSDSDSDSDGDATAAFIRVIHLSADAPAVDVFANGALAFSSLAFKEATAYAEVPAGTYDFDVSAAGSGPEDAVLSIEGLELKAETYYTAAAIGELSAISALALVDDRSEVGMDEIRLRAVHAAAGVGAVDIWNVPAMGDPGQLYDNVAFGQAGEAYELPAVAYNVGFDVNEDALPDLIYGVPALPGGTNTTVFAINDGGGVMLHAVFDDATTATIGQGESSIRVLHLSPDAPPVDVFVNHGDDPAVEGLAFGEGSGFLMVGSAGYDFSVSASGQSADDAVLSIDGFLALPATHYTLVAYDQLMNIAPLALVDDFQGLADDSIRVRAIHAAAGVGQVDIWNVTKGMEPTVLYENVDFGISGAYLDLPAGAYSIGFDVDNDANPDLVYDLPALPAGTIANVFAVLNGSVYLLAQLQDGTTVPIMAR